VSSDPLPRLREIRDIQRRAVKLKEERDWLVRKALREGKSQRQVAKAAGLAPSRVHELALGDRALIP
jgi:hypothetical protein